MNTARLISVFDSVRAGSPISVLPRRTSHRPDVLSKPANEAAPTIRHGAFVPRICGQTFTAGLWGLPARSSVHIRVDGASSHRVVSGSRSRTRHQFLLVTAIKRLLQLIVFQTIGFGEWKFRAETSVQVLVEHKLGCGLRRRKDQRPRSGATKASRRRCRCESVSLDLHLPG